MYEINQNLIGYEDQLSVLIDKINSQKLSNSLILYGNKGIGKCTFVYYFINKYLNSLYKNNNTSNLVYNNSHPNIRLIKKEYDEKVLSPIQDLGFEKKHNPFLRIDELSFLDYLKDENLFTKEDIITRFKLLRVLRDEW